MSITSLRAHANQEGDATARAFEQSHAAYARKDGAGAKELSNEGRAHQREIESLNAEASAWIFRVEYSVPFLKKSPCSCHTSLSIENNRVSILILANYNNSLDDVSCRAIARLGKNAD
jgi:Domain of unknown function (DUF1771)